MDYKKKLMWFSLCCGYGSSTLGKLLKYYGGLEELWSSNHSSLLKSGLIDNATIDMMLLYKEEKILDEKYTAMRDAGIDIFMVDEEPSIDRLKYIHNRPYIMYKRGELALEDKKSIAIIGARRCTQYGMEIAYNYGKELAKRGYTIVSGMADGIDSYAHKGALSVGGRTIAVLGCGVDICYPSNNRQLMDDIANNGCIISEYPTGMEPRKQFFPIRNRIISGLSKGILVVEAGLKSGTLITVEYGLDQGRDIFSIPGNIISRVSKGTNKLIKEGAKIVTDVEDILQEYETEVQMIEDNMNLDGLGEEEVLIVTHLKKCQPVGYERLQSLCGMRTSTFNGLISVLEIKGFIKQLPGRILIIDK